MLAGISDVTILDTSTNLQVGINGDNSCQINFNMNFGFDISAINSGIETEGALNTINDFLTLLNEKSTQLGAIQNRLESALNSIEVNITNLASSRSTIKDADIAEVSSTYIQQQILQQASATLMATANQSPAIALQLI
jgi:flagellin